MRIRLRQLAPIAIVTACNTGSGHDHPGTGQLRLYDNLGTFHREISTQNPETGRWFDQGLRLSYAFNHAEAIRAFEEAARIDSTCAICYWGIAYAYGPNINVPMDSASGVLAWRAVQKARAQLFHASEVERALIEAIATRYADPPPANRTALDLAFAVAMLQVKNRFPQDQDVVTVHADAVMNLSPWDYWTQDRKPKPATLEVLAGLESVIAANPDHPGACHLYIHAVEAVEPQKAVACAERLAALMPGAGHIVHMPAHIYIRVGRWDDAITANQHAVHQDETYIADQAPSGVYPIAYYPHNYHFLSFAAMMAGNADQAISAARATSEKVTHEMARAVPPVEPLVPHLHLVLARFERWEELLATPMPPADLRMATALALYARGAALAATGSILDAHKAADTVKAILDATKDPLNRTILEVAHHALAGEIVARGKDFVGAEAHFRAALAAEDQLAYMEPPHWFYPIRQSLGMVLLEGGKFAEAEKMFREDLQKFPGNSWSLRGLQLLQEAQGKRTGG
jgi:tetratricopeptide (TPR) repeat protein